jgi:CRISPR/Cas system-associated exonuclease Cas4 (RecB family)
MTASVQSMPGEVLSPSQASTFLACSAKWWFRYGLGLPDPPAGGLVRGKAVHAIIEYAMRAKMAGVVLETGALSDVWDAAWDQAAEGAEFQEYDDVEALKSSGARLAQKYVAEALPGIEPAAVEVPVWGTIAGIPVRGIADIVTTDGMVVDVKTASRKPSGLAADHALQLATYARLVPGASGETRIDTLVSTKDTQLIQIDHTPGDAGKRLAERIYPLVAEGIAGGLYLPNRGSSTCSRRYCPYARECEAEYGGAVE